MVIIRGINVFPSQVESALMRIPELGDNYELIVDRVHELAESDAISKEAGRALLKGLDAIVKTKEEEIKTDPSEYGRILSMIDRGEDKKGIQRDIIQSGGLSRADKDSLMNKNLARSGSLDDEYLKKAHDLLKSQFITTGFLQAVNSDEQIRYMKAVVAFDRVIDAAKKTGKPITGQAILEKAIEVAPAYQKGLMEQAEDMSEKIKKDIERMREQGAAKKKTRGAPGAQVPKMGEITYEMTATNPQTGERVGFRNGKWEVIK